MLSSGKKEKKKEKTLASIELRDSLVYRWRTGGGWHQNRSRETTKRCVRLVEYSTVVLTEEYPLLHLYSVLCSLHQ